MAAIGYGVTREKLQVTVKAILDREGRKVNVFNENKPGKDWYYGFLRKHPQLSSRRPEALELSRAKMCSPENIHECFIGFENFLLQHNITDPAQIHNCDESGFPFQPKSGRIIVESSS
ncbi:hypothetical protein HOLleu_43965 [Holothuria leucospilota]|uniref:HTH CENPB-type domain-containing protein n=1 Tax=Holothuria leucospilota TaxID=206669 RepID=A0A9Q0YB28_HOLLE|nr:hypothetical protein HOLleu_43965 [Holothuria leucospilota]